MWHIRNGVKKKFETKPVKPMRLMMLFTLFCMLSPWCASDEATPLVVRSTVLSMGRVAGDEIDTYSPEGNLDSKFEFHDRGGGPNIKAHYVAAADGR